MTKKEGFYFEDLPVGKEFETEYSMPLTEKEVEAYCSLTGETNPTHMHNGYSRRFGLDGRVIPGYLIQPLSAGLVRRDCPLEIITMAANSAKYINPIYLDSSIRVKNKIITQEDRLGKPYGRIVIEREVYNQDDKLCAILEADLRVAKRVH